MPFVAELLVALGSSSMPCMSSLVDVAKIQRQRLPLGHKILEMYKLQKNNSLASLIDVLNFIICMFSGSFDNTGLPHYNTPHYNADFNITWSCLGSQMFIFLLFSCK